MPNINIYGKTHRKNHFVKIECQQKKSISEAILQIFPNIEAHDAKKFDKNYIEEDKDQLLYIDLPADYVPIKEYVSILQSTTSCNIIEQADFNKLRCIFCGIENDEDSWDLKFQRLYPSSYLERSFLCLDNRCELKESKKILMLNNKTDLYYSSKEQRIYFYDFAKANTIINLMQFYRDAEEKDFKKFRAIPFLEVSIGNDKITQRCGKKIAQMLDDNAFEGWTLDKIQKYAQNYNQKIKLTKDYKIQIDTPNDINLIFDIVNERFFTTEYSNNKFRTNSVKPVGDIVE